MDLSHGLSVAAEKGLGLDEPAAGSDPLTAPLDEWDLDDWSPREGTLLSLADGCPSAAPDPSVWGRPPAWTDSDHLAGLPVAENLLPPAAFAVAPHGMHVPAAPARAEPPPPLRGAWLTWLFLSTGLTALMSGVALLIWSTIALRAELWIVGLPIAVAGQVVLLLGLAWHLERVARSNRAAAAQLQRVDRLFHELQGVASGLSATHGTAAQAFYAHMSEGANPQRMLADVKGQLDLLALRIAQDRRRSA